MHNHSFTDSPSTKKQSSFLFLAYECTNNNSYYNNNIHIITCSVSPQMTDIRTTNERKKEYRKETDSAKLLSEDADKKNPWS
jgi:hypothetical protein